MHDIWNPWHGCIKCSEGCQNCYMYFLDEQRGKSGSDIYRTKAGFRYPLARDRQGRYKVQSGEQLRVCMTSDFFLEQADAWRGEAWDIIRQRPDVVFFLLTKRPQRVADHLPPDWGEGWENVFFNVSCENQRRADERIPILLDLPFKHKGVMCAPFIGAVSLKDYLPAGQLEQVIVDGENYCPRAELARQFSKLIEAGLNVVVQGERRMGKTSFVCETVKTIRSLELVYIDLYCVKTIEEFCRRVVAAVAALDRSAGFLRRTAQLIASLRPVLTLDRDTGIPQLTVDSRSANSVASLEEVMDMLSFHASKRKLCIVFDEFQDVLEMADSDVLLARLRAKIQFQNKTPHVFLGSVRNRMHEIFDSPKSPFYKSATSFTVGAIPANDFKSFLAARFKVAKRKVSDTALDRILSIADGISGDVQELCETIWLATDKGDSIRDAEINAGLKLVRNHIRIRRFVAFRQSVLPGMAQVDMRRA